MAELKTQPTEASVREFLDSIDDEQKAADSRSLVEIMQRATGDPPKMWGSAMVGFGEYHYRYESGREGDWFLAGFSPRKRELSLYIMDGFERHQELMSRLGKHRTGKSCLYVKRLSDLNLDVLEQLVSESVTNMRRRHRSD